LQPLQDRQVLRVDEEFDALGHAGLTADETILNPLFGHMMFLARRRAIAKSRLSKTSSTGNGQNQ